MACKLNIETTIKGVINKLITEDYWGNSPVAARNVMKDLNSTWNNINVVKVETVNGVSSIITIDKGLQKAIEYVYDKQIEFENSSDFEAFSDNLVATLKNIENSQESKKEKINIEKSFDNPDYISKLNDNGSIINNC